LIDLIITPFQDGYYGGQGAQQPNDSYQRPDQYSEAPQEEHKKNWLGEHKKELEIGGGILAGAAALAGGYYAYEKHKKGKAEEEDQGYTQGYPPPDAQQRPEEYPEHGSGHSFNAGKAAGGLLAGTAAVGVGAYAYHEHEKHKKEKAEEEERSEEYREQGSGHSFSAGKVGALAAGAAAIGVGAYAYHEHDKHKKEKAEDEKQGLIQGYPPEPQYRPEEDREQRHGHSLTPGMAGGLLAGAAAIGVGAYAYHEHEKHKNGPPTWVEVEGRDNIPENAIEAGKDRDNHPIYIARARYQNSLQVGKACSVFREGAAIGYGGRVVELSQFEVLVGDPRTIRWVGCSYQLNLEELKAKPVEGGREANGAALYVARVQYNGGTHTAKCGEHLPAAHLAFSGSEIQVEDYEVLCYNN